MALRKHDPQLMFHAQQCAENIRVKCGCIGLCRLVCKWSRFAFGTSVIDRHVQPAEAREGIVNKFLDIPFLAHIRPHKLRFSTEISKLDDKLLSLFIVTARNDNLCPFSGESNRSCPPNSCQCSRNQNYLLRHKHSFFVEAMLRTQILASVLESGDRRSSFGGVRN